MKINGKRIVITGAASGIGKETLKLLLKYPDVSILAADLKPDALGIQDSRIKTIAVDISSQEGVDFLFAEANYFLGGIDIFFANAGFAYYETIDHPDWERIEKIYRTNVFSTIYSLEKLNITFENPVLTIATASAMSFLPLPGYALYSSTKAALHSFAESYRFELRRGHKLMLVYPIATRTNFFSEAGKKVPVPFPSQTPKQVARAIIRGIKLNKKRVHPSSTFQVMNILHRHLYFPLRFYQMIENVKRRRIFP